ncbi:hypothetical protein GLOIN_2v1886689 [Rhizophagus irregularis DAOM 181602=DAOM 197198]|nr:hypothetical protein GLOIN_2v1886689 [Rhizophagus irregularis DAOM 181602=DAOM 197198]
MKRLGLNRPLNDELIETLEEIETERNNLLLGEDIYNQPIIKTKPKAPAHQNITTEDIDRIVNSRIQALQQSVPNLSPVSSSEMSSAKLRKIPLEETIRKVLHSELKLIFPSHFFQDSGLIASKQIVASTEAKIVSQNDVSSSSKDSDESSLEEESLDDPMEIDFVKKKEPKTSVATIKCKIRRLKIPAMTLDSGAEPPIITKNIVDRTKDKIDKSEKHDLSGVATVPIESIGIVCNLPITLAPGCIIYEDFVVVDYHKPTLIFSNQLLKKYGCAVDWATNELKIPLNGKDYIIPVTMHKIKNKLEVNLGGLLEEPAQTDPKEIDSLRLELEQIKEDLNSKEYEIECMEKGKESSDSMYKREIDILSSGRLKLIDENRSLRDQLASKKNNEVDTPPLPMNDSSQLDPEGTLSTFNPSSQIISVGGAEAVSLPVTAPIIASSSMSPMLIYSILTLVLITIICFMVRKWWNSRKKSNQFFTYENYINREHRPDFYYLKS